MIISEQKKYDEIKKDWRRRFSTGPVITIKRKNCIRQKACNFLLRKFDEMRSNNFDIFELNRMLESLLEADRGHVWLKRKIKRLKWEQKKQDVIESENTARKIECYKKYHDNIWGKSKARKQQTQHWMCMIAYFLVQGSRELNAQKKMKKKRLLYNGTRAIAETINFIKLLGLRKKMSKKHFANQFGKWKKTQKLPFSYKCIQ